MATTLTIQTLVDTNRRSVIKVFGAGGGDTNAALITAANLAYALTKNNNSILTPGDSGNAKSQYRTTIKRVWGQVHGSVGKYVTLEWENDSNTAIVGLGQGQFDYNFDSEGLTAAIPQPVVANTTGNILFSSTLNASDAFTLFIDLKKDGRDYDQGQTRDPAAFNAGAYSK